MSRKAFYYSCVNPGELRNFVNKILASKFRARQHFQRAQEAIAVRSNGDRRPVACFRRVLPKSRRPLFRRPPGRQNRTLGALARCWRSREMEAFSSKRSFTPVFGCPKSIHNCQCESPRKQPQYLVEPAVAATSQPAHSRSPCSPFLGEPPREQGLPLGSVQAKARVPILRSYRQP